MKDKVKIVVEESNEGTWLVTISDGAMVSVKDVKNIHQAMVIAQRKLAFELKMRLSMKKIEMEKKIGEKNE